MVQRPDGSDALSRRHALLRAAAGTLALSSAGAVLGACGGSRRRQSVAGSDLPDVNWPEGRLADVSRTPSSPSRAALPASPSAGPSGVISRASWAGGGVVPRLMDRAQPYYRITIHHDGMDTFHSRSRSDAAHRLETIRRAHRERNFGDIGYHYLIDPEGRVWAGRPLEWQGAHVARTNQGNLGICIMGNYEQQSPTSETMQSLERFVANQRQTYRIAGANVFTHQELAPTLCPGRTLQVQVAASRRRSAFG